jgi:hypothetical protein
LKDDADGKTEEKGEKKGPEEGRVNGMGVDDEALGIVGQWSSTNWDV